MEAIRFERLSFEISNMIYTGNIYKSNSHDIDMSGEYYPKSEADAEIKRLKYKLLELSNIAHATHKKSDYYDMIENLKLIEHEANIFSL